MNDNDRHIVERFKELVSRLREFNPAMPQIRAAFEYLRVKNPMFMETVSRVLSLMDV